MHRDNNKFRDISFILFRSREMVEIFLNQLKILESTKFFRPLSPLRYYAVITCARAIHRKEEKEKRKRRRGGEERRKKEKEAGGFSVEKKRIARILSAQFEK